MKAKKSRKADLEHRKNQFLQLGFIISLAFTLVAFEWSDGTFSNSLSSSALAYDLPPEIVTYYEFESSPKKIVKPQPTQSKIDGYVNVTEEISNLNEEVDEELVEFDDSEFSDIETEDDPIEYESVSEKKKKISTVGSGGFMFSDGYMPHYKTCEKYSGQEMIDCVNEEIKYNLIREIQIPESLRYTGSKLVITTFTVDEFGKVSEIFIHKEDKYEQDVLDEVKRALSEMPIMIPGSQGGEPVRVRFTLPINLSIQ